MTKTGNKTKKRLIIIIAVIAAVLLITGGIIYMAGGHYVSIRGQKLNKYSYHSGGGMNGGYYNESVERYDENRALISIEKAEWYYQDPEVTEYFTDAAILDELEKITRKYRMNFWNNKKFTDMFVADGESYGYGFDFEKNDINFSSQYYPLRYRRKLLKFDDIIKKYLTDAQKLPGLINTKTDSEEYYVVPEGTKEIYVYSYRKNTLGVKISNGTDKELAVTYSFKLFNTGTDKLIEENEENCTCTVYPRSYEEMSFKLRQRLDAGSYKLVLGEIELPFEIR